MNQRVGLIDRVFLAAETPRTMLHVAALLRFAPPPEADPHYLRALAEEVRAEVAVVRPWNLKLVHPSLGPGPRQRWVPDDGIDLDYHVQRVALPSPGDERELGALVSRLHGRQLDLTRPPWEMYLIEGLDDGGFAMFVKMHHSLIDGYSGMKLLQRSLSMQQDDVDSPILFAARPPRRSSEPPAAPATASPWTTLLDGVRSARALTTAAVAATTPLGPAELVRPHAAPRTIFNARIGRSRRFATQQLDLGELRALGKRHSASLNDVSLSLVGGALRNYLHERDALPSSSLVALVPVSTRPEGDPGGGNVFGAMLATLGTDVDDPIERLRVVVASTRAAKRQLAGMGPTAAIAYASLLVAPTLAQTGLAAVGVPLPGPFSFNLIVSNVPGPTESRYFRGCRLQAMYPASLQLDAAALNITLLSYADTLNFGISGDREAVPHLQRLAVGLREEYHALTATAV